jgi:dehydrogenase/reductase SDR family member 7
MISAYYNAALVRHSLTAAACAAVAMFGMMDANPSLYCYHRWLAWRGPARDYQRHFANKTVWIVGASRGIGEELAYQISPYCGKLILSSRNVDRLQRVALNCKQRQQRLTTKNREPCQVVVLPMDVTSAPEELEEVIQNKLIPELPSAGQRPYLDCVIFNAGQGHQSKVQETKPETTLRMFQVNAIPPIILTQLLLHHQIIAAPTTTKCDKPQIMLTSSVGGRMGLPLSASYAASKHALHGYAASLQAECSSWLRVDMLCPGPIDTEFFQNQPKKGSTTTILFSKGKSPLKMPVERLASLSMSHMVRRSSTGEEAWIAKQPTLLGMYLQQYMPWLWRWALNQKIGPKRVSLYEQGLDLYDPASWKAKGGSRNTKEESPKT